MRSARETPAGRSVLDHRAGAEFRAWLGRIDGARTRAGLHLSPDEVEELDRRILAVLDEYVATDHERLDRPAVGGLFVLHHVKRGDRPTS